MTLPARPFGIGFEIARRLLEPEGTAVTLYGMDSGYSRLGTLGSHYYLEDKIRVESDSDKTYQVFSVHLPSAEWTPDAGYPDLTLREALERVLAIDIGEYRYEVLAEKAPVDVTGIWQKRLTRTGAAQ